MVRSSASSSPSFLGRHQRLVLLLHQLCDMLGQGHRHRFGRCLGHVAEAIFGQLPHVVAEGWQEGQVHGGVLQGKGHAAFEKAHKGIQRQHLGHGVGQEAAHAHGLRHVNRPGAGSSPGPGGGETRAPRARARPARQGKCRGPTVAARWGPWPRGGPTGPSRRPRARGPLGFGGG